MQHPSRRWVNSLWCDANSRRNDSTRRDVSNLLQVRVEWLLTRRQTWGRMLTCVFIDWSTLLDSSDRFFLLTQYSCKLRTGIHSAPGRQFSLRYLLDAHVVVV